MKRRFIKDKKQVFYMSFFFISILAVTLISAGLYFRNRVDNEEGKASEPTYSCAPDAKYIDVSMCPAYNNYAFKPSVNSAPFFKEIIERANSARTNPADEIVIGIPGAVFYLFDDDNNPNYNNGFINLDGGVNGIYPNFNIKGIDSGNKPIFIDDDNNVTKPYMLFSHGNDNVKISNIKFVGSNKNKYDKGLVYIRNSGGNVAVTGIECSGAYGDAPVEFQKGGRCLQVETKSSFEPVKKAAYVEIANSTFKDYNTGAVTSDVMRINVHDNSFDNRNPCQGCQYLNGETNVSFVANFTNKDNLASRSTIRNNVFWQAGGKSEGETAIGIIGQSNKIDILNNTMNNIQDTAFIIGNHNPDNSNPCHGAPRDMVIQGNKFYNTELASILLMNNTEKLDNGCTQDSATMRGIRIIGNESYGGGGSIFAEGAPHSPIYGLEIANNVVKDIVGGPGPDHLGVLDGTCITLAGLKGENNNYDDVKVYGNSLTNCRAGIYLRASNWNDQGDFVTQETNYVNGENRKNGYISIYNNIIKNDNPDFSEILIQEKPVRGIEDIGKVRFSNNTISNVSTTPANGAKRCNASCTSDSECDVPSIQQVYTGIQGTPSNSSSIPNGYPTSYMCSASKCRNSADVNDDNCDLNDQNQSNSVATPIFSPEGGTYTSAQTVSINTTTSGATIRYTLDGTAPTTTVGSIYSVPIPISTTTTLKAIAYKTGSNPSSVSSASYTINTGGGTSPSGTVANPSFITTPSGTNNTFNTSLIVQLSTNTAGATIRYTMNGSDPSPTNGTIYSNSNPAILSNTATIKAIAYKSGMTNSDVVSRTYTQSSGGTTQVANPTISPSATTFASSISVSITTTTNGATIRYTTNGTTPSTTNGTVYSAPFTLTSTTTVRAIAYKSGMTNSGEASKIYTKSSSATSNLVIYAKGTRALRDVTATSVCQNGYPNMVVKYDNLEIGRRCLDATYPSGGYSYTINTANANASKVTIHFTNDFNVVGLEDRNMIIEKIILNGTQTVLPSNLVYAKGQWTPTYGCGLDMERPATYSNRLGCNGYMRLRQL